MLYLDVLLILIACFFVAMHGGREVVELLLKRGHFNRDERDNCKTTPLMDAIAGGFIDVANLLVVSHQVNTVFLGYCEIAIIIKNAIFSP